MSKPSVLFICLDFLTWKRARNWSYTVQLALEEGFLANNLTVVTVPSIHEIPCDSKASFLSHIEEICKIRPFDQVWIELVHNNINDDLLSFLAKTIPVRVGIVAESLQYNSDAYQHAPVLLHRRSQVVHRLQFMTHALVVDEADEADINANSAVKALWWPQSVPSRFIVDTIPPAMLQQATFGGELYGDRGDWFDSPALHNLLIKLPPAEQGTDLPQQFDYLNALMADTLLKSNNLDVQLLSKYSELLRTIRQQSFRLWLTSLQSGCAVVNLPSFFQGYAGRIFEGMAAGRPVISWHVSNRPRTCTLFSDQQEILLFPKERPDVLAEWIRLMQKNPELGPFIAGNAAHKIKKLHTTERRIAQILDWIDSGISPDYLRATETAEQAVHVSQRHYTSIYPESRHAHTWLDGLSGLEIGPSARNPFGLTTRNVGMRDQIYEEEQLRLTGTVATLHIEARADNIPLVDESEYFILSSHVIEHCPNLIKTLLEWFRIIKKDGLIYMIVPHRDSAPSDIGRPLTEWQHVYEDFMAQADEHSEPEAGRFGHCHYHVFDSPSLCGFIEQIFGTRLTLVDRLEQDDKLGNGFTLVYRKTVSNNELQQWQFWELFTGKQTVTAPDMPKKTFVNIGMITFNRLEFTRQVMDALITIPAGYDYSLTVIDNASTDGTREYLQEQKSRGFIRKLVLLNENVGVAKASNLAWSLEPDAAYYLKLDNDIVIQKPHWLGNMVAVIDALPEAGAVAYNFEPCSYPLSDIRGTKVRIKSVGNLGGACILIPRRTHELLGFWCEDYGLYGEEDADLGFRILVTGQLIVYMEDEEVGFHLPAGRAAKIDDKYVANDGIEESMHASYRVWKDETRRSNILSGVVENNVQRYAAAGVATFLKSRFVEQWQQREKSDLQKNAACSAPLKIGVFSLEAKASACPQIRLISPMASAGESLQLLWGAVSSTTTEGTFSTTNLDVIDSADIFVLQRFYPCKGTIATLDKLFATGKPVIYDVDDLITALPDDNHLKPWAEELCRLLPEILPRCSAITVSTPLLAEAFRQYHPSVYVLPNLIDETVWKYSPIAASGEPVVIGFAGTSSHRADLMAIEPVLFRIAHRYGNRVAFRFMGDSYPKLSTLPGYSFITFEEEYSSYACVLSQAGFDIALVPLQDNLFNRCKSNIKWLEYSICGVAGIYSDLAPYNSCIRHGSSGVLVDDDPEKWFQAIALLIERPELRGEIGRNARTVVANYYTIRTKAQQYMDTYQEIMAAHKICLGAEMVPERPKFSIIILTWNRAQMLEKCLSSLFNNLSNIDDCEIIIGNNGSSDETEAVLAKYKISKLIRREKNEGLELYKKLYEIAEGDIIIEIDDDVIELPLHFDLEIARYFEVFPEYGLIGLDVVQNDHTNGAKPDGRYYGRDFRNGLEIEQGPVVGCCMAIRRSLFNSIDGFSGETLTLARSQDWVLADKVNKAGLHTGIMRGIKCFHACGPHYAAQFGRLSLEVQKYQVSGLHSSADLFTSFSMGSNPGGDLLPAPVSIIIPLYDNMAYTRQCLEQLRQNTAAERYELILVDNGCTDDTYTLFNDLPAPVKVIRNLVNQGFAKACNQGAEAASGRVLLFLNNDTLPKSGWLEPPLAAIDRDDADICGSRLIYPDGRCQHAGIAFDERGLGYHIFGGFPGDAAPVIEKRRMQAVTGACLMVKKSLFNELGGFDEGFHNGFEDVDFCLRAGKLGKQILYVPESVVIHYAEQSSGRKDHDVPNMQRFFARWQGKVHQDDQELYRCFGLTSRRESDGRIIVTSAVKSAVAVSIIIPLFNKVELTRACLLALERNTVRGGYELLLVDNNSSDGTIALLREWESKANIIRNSGNKGFAAACNQGARAATGKYLLFLNNDTEVTSGWLEPLVTILDKDPTVAAVGSKLLFPDGTIQHAGVMIVEDQASKDPLVGKHHYFRFPGNHPPANVQMQMQAVTAACVLMRRTSFEAVGGFDEGYWNGYEDLDLCFKFGSRGWKVIYQPASVIIHHESQSGTERFRLASENIKRLHQRWLGRIKTDLTIMPDTIVQDGPGILEGLTGAYKLSGEVTTPPVNNSPHYPLISLVGKSASSILQKLSSSQKTKSVLNRYTNED